MNVSRRISTTVVVLLAVLGVGASQSAAAYSLSGGSYIATGSGHTFAFSNGNAVVTCSATLSGNATGAATTTFTPVFTGCGATVSGLSFMATAWVAGPWSFVVTGGGGPGGYSGTLALPWGSGMAIALHDPSDPSFTCEIDIPDLQGPFTGSTVANVVGGSKLGLGISHLNWTVTGDCAPWFDVGGSYATYAGEATAPGMVVSGP